MNSLTVSFSKRLATAYSTARDRLLAERTSAGVWEGELSSSALSTATATIALSLVDSIRHADLIAAGFQWLRDHQNDDGGWGDVPGGLSNISTTSLVNAAFMLRSAQSPIDERLQASIHRADAYLTRHAGGATSSLRAAAVRARYGKDRTFSIPILCCCAIAGVVPWHEVERLPFELACAPASFYRWLRLPVVSYALPALIAVGLATHVHRPPRLVPLGWLRDRAAAGALRKLTTIQPESGGFLEATPLTSFVVMSLVAAGRSDHPVVARGVDFLVRSARSDGSWPIDTHLATWVTTLATNALQSDAKRDPLDTASKAKIRSWLLDQQYQTVHPYTDAAPGGWAWSPLSGGVPDADDTPGALLSLHRLGIDERTTEAAAAGVRWLLDLQNNDGGWPTFCRGWGYLPFDRSGADLTAHALRALVAWRAPLTSNPQFSLPDRMFDSALRNGLRYLERSQRPSGAWTPLWFGNEHTRDNENFTFGTARVLAAYRDLDLLGSEPAQRGAEWLVQAQNDDGSWGGDVGIVGSVEETALATEALISVASKSGKAAAVKGIEWLISRIEDGTYVRPATIGFYFAKLWYFETLYPIIFTVSALARAAAEPVD